MIDENIGKKLAIYASILGILYVIFGFREIIAAFSDYELETEPLGLFGGFALIVIGAVYFFGIKNLKEAKMEGLSFFMGGIILSAIFGILYLLIMGANALDYLVWLGTEDEIGTSFREDFGPAIWLFFVTLPGGYWMWKNRLLEGESF